MKMPGRTGVRIPAIEKFRNAKQKNRNKQPPGDNHLKEGSEIRDEKNPAGAFHQMLLQSRNDKHAACERPAAVYTDPPAVEIIRRRRSVAVDTDSTAIGIIRRKHSNGEKAKRRRVAAQTLENQPGGASNGNANRKVTPNRNRARSVGRKVKIANITGKGKSRAHTPILDSMKKVSLAALDVNKSLNKLGSMAMKFIGMGMALTKDSRFNGSARATHFMGHSKLTSICDDKAYRMQKPTNKSIEDINPNKFEYNCNIYSNEPFTNMNYQRGERIIPKGPTLVSTGHVKNFKPYIFERGSRVFSTPRYISVIFPHGTDDVLFSAAFTRIKTYLMQSKWKEPEIESATKMIREMASPESTVKWTEKSSRRFDSADYSTHICAVNGVIELASDNENSTNHRFVIQRKYVTTCLKKSSVLTHGNMVICEEIVIQMQSRGGSPGSTPDSLRFTNTDSSLIITAQNISETSTDENQKKEKLHFQGKNALSVTIPDEKFLTIRRDEHSMKSLGWLLGMINSASKHTTADATTPTVFFNAIISDTAVKKNAIAKYRERISRNNQELYIKLQGTDDDSILRDKIDERHYMILQNSFITHQKTCLIQDRCHGHAIKLEEWFSTSSFAVIVVSPASKPDLNYVFIRTYQLPSDPPDLETLDSAFNTAGLERAAREVKGSIATNSGNFRAASELLAAVSSLPEELELELEML
jgi:hypothetical protein